MAKQPEAQNIKSRARRRLIGAATLALGVIVILPMVLDREPKITGNDIELSIPSPDKVGVFMPAVAISGVVDAGESAASGISSAASAPAGAAVSGKITRVEMKPVAATQAEKRDPAELKPAAPEDVVKAKPAAKLSLLPPQKTPEKIPEKKPESPTDGYIVQVAAFANAETAAQQAEQLKSWGFKAYTEMISGTTRVRLGPYAEKKSAEKVQTLLQQHGLHPVIKTSK